MDHIRTILKTAGRRLETGSLLHWLHLALAAGAAAVLLLLIVERLGAEPFWPWPWLLPALAVAALVAAGWAWRARRRSELQVAVEVDERLELREKLSTALHVAHRSDPFAQAAVEDAAAAARDPRVREQVRRRFPVPAPPRGWIGPLLVLAAVGASLLPPLDLFRREAAAGPEITQTVQQRNAAIESVVERVERNPRLKEELSDMLGDLSDRGTDPDALHSREEVRRDAIKKLTDLNRRLDEIVNGPEGKTAEALKRALERLKTPEEGPAKELAEAMARGDFQAARKALQELKAKLESGELSEQQKKELQQQLAELSKQMEELARQQQALEAMLKKAGMNPQLAQNPDALKKAIENNPNLNEQQKRQLQQMAQAQQAAAQMCQGLGQGLGQMAQGLMEGQMAQAAAGRLGEQLSELEAMNQFLMQAQAAASACQGQCRGLGQGLAMGRGLKSGSGGAFGGRGQGAGGKAPVAPTPTGRQIARAPTENTGGDIIARQLIEGPTIVGESRAELRQVSAAVSEGYDEAQSEELVPPKYREAQMHYFGELKKRVEAVAAEEGADEPPASDDG